MIDSELIDAQDVTVETAGVTLEGSLAIPENALGVVVFAHGSGSSRFSRRNTMVADHLNRNGMATLLFDLLTYDESEIDEHTRQYRFDIGLLVVRAGSSVTKEHSQSVRIEAGKRSNSGALSSFPNAEPGVLAK